MEPSPQQHISTSQTGIKWHEVTWYSKLGAIVLFCGIVPALAFYIGMQYQSVQQNNFLPSETKLESNSQTNTLPLTTAPIGQNHSDPLPKGFWIENGKVFYASMGHSDDYYPSPDVATTTLAVTDPATFGVAWIGGRAGGMVIFKDSTKLYRWLRSDAVLKPIPNSSPSSLHLINILGPYEDPLIYGEDKNQFYCPDGTVGVGISSHAKIVSPNDPNNTNQPTYSTNGIPTADVDAEVSGVSIVDGTKTFDMYCQPLSR